MFNIKAFLNGIKLIAKTTLASDTKGELEVENSSGKLNYHNGTTRSPVVTESHTSTLTNKTFDANGTGNVLSNVETADLASGVLNVSTTLATASDTQIPSALAVKTYVDDSVAEHDQASEISYDNATSGLVATNVQDAIDEVEGRVTDDEIALSDHISDATGAHAASAISNVAAGNLSATDVQGALNELQGDVDTNATNISDHISDTSGAHAASAISNTPSGNLAATEVQAALNELQGDIDTNTTGLSNHLADATDAHAASAITNTPSGSLAATDVQGALNELQTDVDTRATATALSDHISDATGAHAASAISNTASGNLSATDVQGALNELQTDVDTRATSTDLTNHTSATAAHGATGAVVGTTNTQTLTNKTLTTPIIDDAASFEEITTPSNPSAGYKKVYPKADGKFYTLDSSGNEIALGSGASSLDVWHTEDFEATTASDATAGNNATFLGAGAATASPTNETSSPIAGTRSIKYTQEAGSLNDYGAFPAVDTELKQRNNWSGFTFYSTYSGNDDDTSFIVYDVTNAAVLYDMPIKASSGRQRHEFASLVPESCTSIRYGYHVKVENIGAILVIDDIDISTNPFVYKDLSNDTDWSEYIPTITGAGTPTEVNFIQRRDGSDLLVRFRFVCGTSTAVAPKFSIPYTPVNYAQLRLSGSAKVSVSSTTGYVNTANLYIQTGGVAEIVYQNNATAITEAETDATNIMNVGNAITGSLRIPIEGWSVTSENVVTPATSVWHTYSISQLGNALTNRAGEVEFNLGTATISSTFNSTALIVASDDAGNTRTKFIATKNCVVQAHWQTTVDTAGQRPQIFKNGSIVSDGNAPYVLNAFVTSSASIYLAKDDYITVSTETSVANIAGSSRLQLAAYATEVLLLGTIPKDRQYNLTVTGTGWTTVRAVGVPYQTAEGGWRMKFNFEGTVSSSARTSYTATITGVAFYSGTNQSVSGDGSGLANAPRVSTGSNNGNINFSHSSTTTDAYRASGDVELASKPTFI